MPKENRITPEEKQALRKLARRAAEIHAGPRTQERIRLWKMHNSLKPERPMILIFPEGGWREIIAAAGPALQCVCREEWLKRIEWELRSQIYTFEHFESDNVMDPEAAVGKVIRNTGWGVRPRWIHSGMDGGARKFDPVIRQPSDLKKLRYPEVVYDEKTSRERFETVQELLGDIIPVKQTGVSHVSFHLMNLYTSLRGLEEVMMDMAENPRFLRDAMSFLEEGNRRLVKQYEEMNLLELNNNNTYHSSGGNGWTDDLPREDFDPNHVRPRDMWASAEAQELALVSPRMHEEFSLQYEKRLLEPFALNGYGCCEDLTLKLDDVLTIPNIRRVSISPFADAGACAAKLGPDYIFSWKPHPGHLVGKFNPGAIGRYIRRTLEVCRERQCVLEIILKDTHSCEHHPERFAGWSQAARREVQAMYF